jgi:hypothetical protein
MAEWVSCSARTTEVLRLNLGKSLIAVSLGSPGRCILIMCDIHWPLWLVSLYGELKWLSGRNLRQAGLLSRAPASNSCRENIRLSKLSPDSTLYRKVAERRGFLLLMWTSLWCFFPLETHICSLPRWNIWFSRLCRSPIQIFNLGEKRKARDLPMLSSIV